MTQKASCGIPFCTQERLFQKNVEDFTLYHPHRKKNVSCKMLDAADFIQHFAADFILQANMNFIFCIFFLYVGI